MARKYINIKFPFKETQDGGVFDGNITTENALKSDLIALLTLKKRQRPMRRSMFSPIYNYLMEPIDDTTKSGLDDDIRAKVAEFIPQIIIKKINFTENKNANLLGIEIVFSIKDMFDVTDKVKLNFPLDPLDESELIN